MHTRFYIYISTHTNFEICLACNSSVECFVPLRWRCLCNVRCTSNRNILISLSLSFSHTHSVSVYFSLNSLQQRIRRRESEWERHCKTGHTEDHHVNIYCLSARYFWLHRNHSAAIQNEFQYSAHVSRPCMHLTTGI